MTWIMQRLGEISDFFYELYLDCYYAGWPLEILDTWFYSLSRYFADLSWDFYDFNLWLVYAADKIAEILSYSDIWTYFGYWLYRAEWAWDWVTDAFWNVWNITDDWWSSTQYTVLAWIADLESWTQGQLNSLRDFISVMISDVESWTTTQLNNIQATLTSLITDLGLWTTTQLNNLQATFNALISNVEAWTVTQIDNVKSTILAVIGDLETWTITEINTIQSILTTLIDWAALTTWITTWWNERLLDIQSLIDSAFSIREPFWAGWQDWRDKVTEFFTDPEDWLYKAADRIVERFW